MHEPLPFFATRLDLLQVLMALQCETPVKYVEAGMYEAATIREFDSADAIDHLGEATAGDQSLGKTYLVAPNRSAILVREVPQRFGGVRYSVDQRINPETLGIRPGGRFGERFLIAGQLGPSTGHPSSEKLSACLVREVRQQFIRIGSYLVGKEALALLDQGMRLTVSSFVAEEYDLRR